MNNTFLLYGFIISICAFICVSIYCCKLITIKEKRVEINKAQIQYNQKLDEQGKILQAKISECEQDLINKQNYLNSLNIKLQQTYENQEKIIQDKAKTEYYIRTQQLEKEYNNHTEHLEKEYKIMLDDLFKHSQQLREEINKQKQDLMSLQEKQATYTKEQQHKEEMLAQKDYYRLNISHSDIEDIEMLRNIQSKFSHKEAIDKLIWDIYYKPAYDILMSHLFENNNEVCGIYKITCIENDKAYIGQSVDIKERFRSHIRTALSNGSSSNKLYQEMKKYQPYNFLFEILEVVPRNNLNEREIYWINFYKTKEYGLNNTKGGS